MQAILIFFPERVILGAICEGAASENKQAVLRRTACLKNDLFGEELLLLGLGGRLRLVKFGHHVVREIEGVT